MPFSLSSGERAGVRGKRARNFETRGIGVFRSEFHSDFSLSGSSTGSDSFNRMPASRSARINAVQTTVTAGWFGAK